MLVDGFTADTIQDMRLLRNLRDKLFVGVSTKLIQDCYNILKDPLVIYNIFLIAIPENRKKDYSSTHPNLSKERSSEKYRAVMASLLEKKKSNPKQVVLKGSGLPMAQKEETKSIIESGVKAKGGTSKFWTVELLDKLNCFNN